MSVLGVVLVVGIVLFLVMPMWSIVATDFWHSVVLHDNEVKMQYPWVMTLLGPTVMSAICVGVAYLVSFDVWLAIGLCLICVVNGMMTGFGALFNSKDNCELRVVVAYFAVIFMLIFAAMETLSRVCNLAINGWI